MLDGETPTKEALLELRQRFEYLDSQAVTYNMEAITYIYQIVNNLDIEHSEQERMTIEDQSPPEEPILLGNNIKLLGIHLSPDLAWKCHLEKNTLEKENWKKYTINTNR
ncbi:unnamed protein product [Didymodactylos carnosus]|uniref:Uncharacterized protein n=1 Tax=Didymodactylos carnosus TaxID=1234261 RepID=A0A815AUU5_9BILA|nr:unnamed protein product [Didymodactylos carnosus]CAF4042512.1 unnamed protein product [Didymodactylos carnosus]